MADKFNFVCKVPKEDGLGDYKLHTIWSDNSFQIKIVGKETSWSGYMSEEIAKETSSKLQLNVEDYLNQCKEALTTHNGKQDISYMIDSGCFVWKKLIDAETGIKVKLGSVVVQPANFHDSVEEIVNFLLTCNDDLQKQVSKHHLERTASEACVKSLYSDFENLTKEKNSLESALYSSFITILNAKKRKILELEKFIEEKESKTTNLTKPSTSNAATRKASRSSLDDECYNVETDSDESETNKEESAKAKRSKYEKPAPGESTRKLRSNKSKGKSIVSKSAVATGRNTRMKSKRTIEDDPSINTISKDSSRLVKRSSRKCSFKKQSEIASVSPPKKKKSVMSDSDATISDESLQNYATSTVATGQALSPEVHDNVLNSAIQDKILEQIKTKNCTQTEVPTNSKNTITKDINTSSHNIETSVLDSKKDKILDFFFGKESESKQANDLSPKSQATVFEQPSKNSKSAVERILEELF